MGSLNNSPSVRRSVIVGLTIALILLVGGFFLDSQADSDKTTFNPDNYEQATFAGGCFWCMEPPFEKLDGVPDAVSGYMGGHVKNPTYKEVSSGKSGHLEVVRVYYDPQKVTYKKLLEVYWRQIDPTDDAGQFVDRGQQYLSRVFYHDENQKTLAEKSKRILEQSTVFQEPIVTEIVPADTFYRAEAYHQNYYRTHSWSYRYYRSNSGRDQFLERTWSDHENFTIFGNDRTSNESQREDRRYTMKDFKDYTKPADEKLRDILSPTQYKITQKDGTEPAFQNEYYDNKKAGIYVDVVSGEPLFSSKHKFESGTGWPSFYKPLVEKNIVERKDTSLFRTRTEVRSRHADSHLGHVFEDGPEPTGLRYCINSAALKFIPADELEERGYGQFADAVK